MTSSSEVGITLAEARELVAASVGSMARDHQIRVLLIKGSTLAAHGLRSLHESADVDVLVAPSDGPALITLLGERGWQARATDTTAHVMPQHSVTLVNPRWPLELDVHHRFPGFLAEPDKVFDALWERHQALRQAHHPVAMPDLVGSILIAALNYERAPDVNAGALRDLVQRAAAVLDDDGRGTLGELATRTGCADTLHDFLGAVGVSVPEGTSDPAALSAWNLFRSGGRVAGVAWLEAIRRAPWNRRPAILWHALLFTEDELRFRYPNAPAGPRGVWLARFWRLREAIHALPQALRVLRSRGGGSA